LNLVVLDFHDSKAFISGDMNPKPHKYTPNSNQNQINIRLIRWQIATLNYNLTIYFKSSIKAYLYHRPSCGKEIQQHWSRFAILGY